MVKVKQRNGGNSNNPDQGTQCRFERPQVQAVRIEATTEDNARNLSEENFRTEQLRLSSSQNRITAISAGVSIFTLLMLLGTLYYTSVATRAATSQTETSQKEFRSSQRPWVAIQFQAGGLQFGPGAAWMETTVHMKNVGHSIATNVIYHGLLRPSQSLNGHECETVSKEAHASPDAKNSGVAIFPEEDYTRGFPATAKIESLNYALAHPLNPNEPRNMSWYFIGCVSYTSPIDEDVHYTQIKYLLEPPSGGFFDWDNKNPQPVALIMDINGTNAT